VRPRRTSWTLTSPTSSTEASSRSENSNKEVAANHENIKGTFDSKSFISVLLAVCLSAPLTFFYCRQPLGGGEKGSGLEYNPPPETSNSHQRKGAKSNNKNNQEELDAAFTFGKVPPLIFV
jgi:hypothetical protein